MDGHRMDALGVTAKLGFQQRMELHNELYGAAVHHWEQAQALGSAQWSRHATRAAELLERIVILRPENWNALWLLGMVHRSLEQHESAYAAFKGAYAMQPGHRDVCREFAQECIILGKGPEAVAAASAACTLDPSDIGLVSNLALAYLINQQVEVALATVQQARRQDPADPITARLSRLIEAVARHEIEAPTQWPPR